MQETIKTIVARIEERLKNFIEQNKTDHVEIKAQVSKLDEHVNHEIEKIIGRVKVLEDNAQAIISEETGRNKLYKAVIIVLGSIIGILTFLHGIGMF